jgi:hypothetical protein
MGFETLVAQAESATTGLTPKEAQQKLQSGDPILLLDVREREMYPVDSSNFASKALKTTAMPKSSSTVHLAKDLWVHGHCKIWDTQMYRISEAITTPGSLRT